MEWRSVERLGRRSPAALKRESKNARPGPSWDISQNRVQGLGFRPFIPPNRIESPLTGPPKKGTPIVGKFQLSYLALPVGPCGRLGFTSVSGLGLRA